MTATFEIEQTRRLRGVGTMFEFSDDTPLPVNFWDDFLHNSQNKNMLNEYLGVKMISSHSGDKFFNVTPRTSVLSHTEVDQTSGIIFCTSEEADQRQVRHARNALSQRYQMY